MAVNIGPRIGIEGEDAYRKSIMNLVQQTKTLDAQMKALASTSDKETSAQEKAAKAAELLSQKQDVQKKRVEELKKMVAQSAEATGENSTQTLKWKQALADAESELNKTESELDDAKKAADGFGDEVDNSADQMKAFNAAAVEMARRDIANILNQAANAAANFGKKTLGSVVETTKDFDTAMSNVKALSGATASEFDTLRQKARKMGETTKYSATESAEALSYMALAGWDTNQMVEGLDGVLNLAAASNMELAEASDLVTDFLSAFGKEAKDAAQMADMMAYAQAHSNTTTAQLGEAFRNSAANMNTAGQSMETTTALLEAMANQGNKGSEAGTALAAMMRDLTQKMKDGKIYIGETAVQVMDANGNFRNMIDILSDVDAATQGMGTAQKSAALMTTFTARSVKGVNQVLNEGVDSLYQYETELKGAGGAASEMADTMQDNLQGQLTILKSQMQELAISVGDELTPFIRKAVDAIQIVIDKFNAMPSGVKKAVAVLLSVGTATAVIVPKVLAFVNTIKSLQAATQVVKSVKQMNGELKNTGDVSGGASKSLSSVAKGVGIVSTAVVGSITVIKAANNAIKEWRMENDEAYASTMRFASRMSELKNSAKDYGIYLEDLKAEVRAESEMEMTAAERAQSASQKITELRERQREAEKNLTIAKQELINKLGSEELAEEALRHGQLKGIDAASGFARSLDGLFGKTTGGIDAYNSIVASIEKYNEQTEASDELVAELTKVLEKNGYALEDAEELASNFGDAVGDMADDVDDAADDVEDSFADIYNAAKENISKSINILDKWADDSGKTMDEIAEIMAQNAQAMADWDRNVATLTSDARYKSDANFRALVDSLVKMEGGGAIAMKNFADAVKRGDDQAIASWVQTTSAATTESNKVINRLASLEAAAKTTVNQTAVDMAQMPTAAGRGLSGYKNVAGQYVEVAKEMPKKISANMYGGRAGVTSASNAIGTAMGSGLPSAKTAQTSGGAYPVNVASGMRGNIGAISSAAAAGAQAASEINKYGSDAYTWGMHLAQNYADGMNRKLGEVRQAAYSGAQSIANYWGHTTPKMGPMAHDDKWGIHFMENWIDALLSQESKLASAAMQAAEAISEPMLSFGVGGIHGQQIFNMDYDAIYDAVSAAMSEHKTSLVIGNREFGRILREATA